MSTNYYDKENNKLIKISGKGDFPADYGTKEEFEAKKDSLPDGTVFTTTDEFVDAHAENYSTDEVVIGKWIDGKTLYRKVFIVPESNWAITAGEYNPLNIDFDFSDKTFIRASGSIRRADGFEHQIGSHFSTLTIRHNLTKPFYIFCNQWGTTASLFARVYLIVEYTKN